MLQIEHLTKAYGDKKAVDDLSLHIRPGEIYGFIGPTARARPRLSNPLWEYFGLIREKYG